ncbi:MAG: type II toxin-antitoxin system RelE family toxin [Candidatus Limnocylindria bacterium]
MPPRYRVRLLPTAAKALEKLVPSVRHRLKTAIDRLEREPRPAGVKALSGQTGLLRIRVGDYRIIYRVVDDELLIFVIRIGHRAEAYRAAALRQVRRRAR